MKLEQVLIKDYVLLDLDASDKDQAIIKLISVLCSNGILTDVDKVYSAVLAREKEFSTGIGFGIAIPHAQTEYVLKTAIAVGRTMEKFVWEGEVDTEVDLVFLILVPKDSIQNHLEILAQMSRKLMHDNVRQSIRESKTREEVIEILL